MPRLSRYPILLRRGALSVAGSVWCIPKRVFDMKLKLAPPPKKALVDFLKKVRLFERLTQDQIVQLARAAVEKAFNPGEEACTEGEIASSMFAVHTGKFTTTVQGHEKVLYTAGKGDSFGESALFHEEELRMRRATVKAASPDASLLIFHVDQVEALVGYGLQQQSVNAFNRKLLCSVKVNDKLLAEGLPAAAIDAIVGDMKEVSYAEGETVVSGSSSQELERLYLIKRGSVMVAGKKASGKSAGIAELHLRAGEVFSDRSLLKRGKARMVSNVGPGKLLLITVSMPSLLANPELEAWRQEHETLFVGPSKDGKDAEVETPSSEPSAPKGDVAKPKAKAADGAGRKGSARLNGGQMGGGTKRGSQSRRATGDGTKAGEGPADSGSCSAAHGSDGGSLPPDAGNGGDGAAASAAGQRRKLSAGGRKASPRRASASTKSGEGTTGRGKTTNRLSANGGASARKRQHSSCSTPPATLASEARLDGVPEAVEVN